MLPDNKPNPHTHIHQTNVQIQHNPVHDNNFPRILNHSSKKRRRDRAVQFESHVELGIQILSYYCHALVTGQSVTLIILEFAATCFPDDCAWKGGSVTRAQKNAA